MSLRTTIIKKLIAVSMSGWSKGSIEAQRARQERNAKYMAKLMPADIGYHPINAGGVPGAWIAPPDAGSGVMLYLHGGAYTLGSVHLHRELLSRLAHASHARVLGINYRLAPEHPYPAALEDATAAYGWLRNIGVPPSHTIIAGDSAGGGLTLATLITLRDAGNALPAGAVCLSPWTDLTLSGDSVQSKAKSDPMLHADHLRQCARDYAGAQPLTLPLISPLYADLAGLPPLLIQVGTDEILLDDTTRLADQARAAGVDVTLEIWDDMFHVFQMLGFLKETKKALVHIAEFTSKHIKMG